MGFLSGLFGGSGISANKASTANTTTNANTTDNRRTLTGDAVNLEGSGNTVSIERADASTLQAVAGVLGDMSFDLSQNIGAGFDTVRGLSDVNAASNAAFLNALTANRDAELKANAQSIRELSDGFAAAKGADAAAVNTLAKNGLAAAVAVAGLGLLVVILRNRKS